MKWLSNIKMLLFRQRRKYILGLKKLPFVPDEKQIIYVEGKYDKEVNRYIQKNYEHIKAKFESWGYKFCYIPYLTKELAESESMKYYAPFAAKVFKPVVDLKSDYLLDWLIHHENREKIKPSLLYYHPYAYRNDYKEAESQFLAITLAPGYKKTNDLSPILKEIHLVLSYYDKQMCPIRCHFAPQDKVDQFKKDLANEEERKEIELFEQIAKKYRRTALERNILATLAYGEDGELSPLLITKDFRIILTATGYEVKMYPLPKTVFLFFLNHKESIDCPHLIDYKGELRDIYMRLLGTRIVTYEINKRINDLVDYSNNNSINEKVHYIRAAFCKFMEEHIASNYFVSGDQGKTKGIKLSRDLVHWECDMVPPTHVKEVVGGHEIIRDNW